jgi:hypothetical protein
MEDLATQLLTQLARLEQQSDPHALAELLARCMGDAGISEAQLRRTVALLRSSL